MDVDSKSTVHKDSIAGQTYYFCSQNCLVKFRSEPARYVTPPAPPLDAQPGKAATGHTDYVCSMHPQIVRSEPGSVVSNVLANCTSDPPSMAMRNCAGGLAFGSA